MYILSDRSSDKQLVLEKMVVTVIHSEVKVENPLYLIARKLRELKIEEVTLSLKNNIYRSTMYIYTATKGNYTFDIVYDSEKNENLYF